MKHILVGFHGSERGRDAIELARALAHAIRAKLTVVTVITRQSRTEREAADDRLAGYVTAHLSDLGIAVEARCVESSSPAVGSSQLAGSTGADLVVLGSSRRGAIGRIVPGGTAKRLLRDSPCGVAVASRGFASQRDTDWHPLSESQDEFALRVIGVGYDGSPEGEEACGSSPGRHRRFSRRDCGPPRSWRWCSELVERRRGVAPSGTPRCN